MYWQSLFRDIILDRGYHYFQDGFVQDIIRTNIGYSAVVSGTIDYEVNIELEGDSVGHMTCTCPYAADGSHCKHMAAVLFSLEQETMLQHPYDLKDNLVHEGESNQFITSMVQNADVGRLREFLIEQLRRDDRLLGQFKLWFADSLSEEDISQYKREVNMIFRSCQDGYGYIDYHSATTLQTRLEEFLEEIVQSMLDNSEYTAAFRVLAHIYVCLSNQEIDDSDGEIVYLANKCRAYWRKILEGTSDISLKKTMFQWFRHQLHGGVIDYMAEKIEEILVEEFPEKKFLINKLDLADEMIAKYSKYKNVWSAEHHVSVWVAHRLNFMRAMGMSKDSILAYQKEYWHFPTVRQAYIDDCLERGEYREAIQTLVESKKIDADRSGLVRNYRKSLKDIYRKQSNIEAYRAELWELVKDGGTVDLGDYLELRALYPNEVWQTEREAVFRNVRDLSRLNELFLEEELFDRLLRNIQADGDLEELHKYEKVLKPIFPDQLLAIYENVVSSMIERATNRARYRELVIILNRMLKYPGGRNLVAALVDNWRNTYPRRRAMFEELSRLKYDMEGE